MTQIAKDSRYFISSTPSVTLIPKRWHRMMQEIRRVSNSFLDFLTSAWTSVSIILALGAVIVVQVRSDADRDSRIQSLERNYDVLAKKADDIDRLGTRTLSERLQHITDTFTALEQRSLSADEQLSRRLDVMGKRLTDIDAALGTARDQSVIVKERQDSILRRLDSVEKAAAPIDVMRNDLLRLAEQQSRILQALDNTYNTLQEAIRDGQITRKPMPGGLQRGP